MKPDSVDLDEFFSILSEVASLTRYYPQALLTELLDYSFGSGARPDECDSDDPFPDLPKTIEILPVDLLGKYEPHLLRITIYNHRIEQVARVLAISPSHLSMVVRLHEWSHALVHVGQSQDLPPGAFVDNKPALSAAMAAANRLWRRIDDELHEVIAQLLTWHCAQRIADNVRDEYPRQAALMTEAFDALSSIQPRPYRLGNLKDIPLGRVRDAFDMLKRGQINPSGFRRVLELGLSSN